MENKQKFIAQIDKGDLTIREASDIDETALSYAEIKAITTANPKIKRKMELEAEISRLRTLESEHRSSRYHLQDLINKDLPQRITRTGIIIDNIKADIARRNSNATAKFQMQLGNKTYTERKDAGEMLLAVMNSGKYNNKIIGRMNGFDIIPLPMTQLDVKPVTLRGDGSYNVECSTDAVGNIIRLENFFKKLEDQLQDYETRLTSQHNELATAKNEVEKGFEYTQTLETLSAELATIDAELDLNKQEIATTVIDDEKFKDEVAPAAPETDAELDEDDEIHETEVNELEEPEIDENLEAEVDNDFDDGDGDEDELDEQDNIKATC